MAQLLLINPKVKPSKRKRKGVKVMAKKRSAAQKRATAKLVAFNKSKRHSNPVKKVEHRKSKRKSNPISVVHRKTGKSVSARSWKKSKYRRNPIMSKANGIIGQVTSAGIAAAGAISLDVAWSFLPLPDMIKVGPMRHVAKAVGAIGLGMLAGMLVKKETANSLAAGALTVVMYNAAREVLTNVAPQIALGEYVALEQPTALSEFLSGDDDDGDVIDGIATGEDDYSMSGYEWVG